jgi:hypothetical protein
MHPAGAVLDESRMYSLFSRQAGQHERAEAVARSITNPGEQAWALAAVAKALVARGDTRQAHHVASAACAVGGWTTVLELLLSLEPSAVRVLTGP